MDKKAYYNSVTDQVKALDGMAVVQGEKCFDLDKLKACLPEETARNIQRVIITERGDSYSAAGAILPGFKALSGVKKCNSPDIIDFCHYYTDLKIRKGFEMDQVLVISISASGSSERVADALTKATGLGAHSLLLTRNPDSKAGRAAKYCFNVETPDGCNTPGLRSYYASLMGLAAIGAYLGLCKGTLTREDFLQVRDEIVNYTRSFMAGFEQVDELMFREALRMKDLTKFEVIADWNEGYSAQFVEQKFIECGGVYCDHTTSEEFAHISFFFRRPADFGTVIMINEDDPSLGRMKDTIKGCLEQHRPTLIVTDAAPQVFAINQADIDNAAELAKGGFNSMAAAGTPTICPIPKAPRRWMSVFVDFLPGSLLAGYQALVNERMFFNGRYDFRTQTWNRG